MRAHHPEATALSRSCSSRKTGLEEVRLEGRSTLEARRGRGCLNQGLCIQGTLDRWEEGDTAHLVAVGWMQGVKGAGGVTGDPCLEPLRIWGHPGVEQKL